MLVQGEATAAQGTEVGDSRKAEVTWGYAVETEWMGQAQGAVAGLPHSRALMRLPLVLYARKWAMASPSLCLGLAGVVTAAGERDCTSREGQGGEVCTCFFQ